LSYAINTPRTSTATRTHARARTVAAERVELSRAEQLREGRALMRHFVLAFLAAGAVLYAVFAAGLAL
jgi:hypothetical protein